MEKGPHSAKMFQAESLFKNHVENLHVLSKSSYNKLQGIKFAWKLKYSVNFIVAYASLSTYQDNIWYFDSGCFRHMFVNISLPFNIKPYDSAHITNGDGKSGKIIGKESINILGLLSLYDELFVNGQRVNLISISQICDNNLTVQFSKCFCKVLDGNGKCVLEEVRSNDN